MINMFFNNNYTVFTYKACGGILHRCALISRINIKRTLHFTRVEAVGKNTGYCRVMALRSVSREV